MGRLQAGQWKDEKSQMTTSEAQLLNLGCFCSSLDRDALAATLDQQVGVEGFADRLMASHLTLFSNVPVFVPANVLNEMMQIVSAVEAAARLPGYRAAALSVASSLAIPDFGPVGAFMGYDFHITPRGPRLIETNTNAGGAFLNAVLAQAQRACCAPRIDDMDGGSATSFGTKIANMFVEEWQRQRGPGRPARIAIVDDEPERQHLYPEFQLAKSLLEEHAIETVICDAAQLTFNGGELAFNGLSVDLVYNRLVDFSLEEPRHAALRAAYAGQAVVVSPNPHVHALLADKRNLALLSNSELMKDWGLPSNHRSSLKKGVPKTQIVSEQNADDLWRDRKQLFFKPARGHGSKAAYRGDKLTRRVWSEITSGNYVAQTFTAPSLREIAQDGEQSALKVDLRLYCYAGSLLLAAARLYQGQTTNMRTPGGGFAPVLIVRDNRPRPLTEPCDIEAPVPFA